MLFTGIFCLLAGLASASTAAVNTIVAAPTEAEQADRARSPNSNGTYKKRRHIQVCTQNAVCTPLRQNPCV
ncbi:hypothetical protein V8C86DRAFT_2828944 [Haematococcus lacustris]